MERECDLRVGAAGREKRPRFTSEKHVSLAFAFPQGSLLGGSAVPRGLQGSLWNPLLRPRSRGLRLPAGWGRVLRWWPAGSACGPPAGAALVQIEAAG